MLWDLSSQPQIVQRAAGHALQGWDIAMAWLTSLAALCGALGVGIGFGLQRIVANHLSDVLFLIWNARKDHKIKIPYPYRVIEMRTAPGGLAS